MREVIVVLEFERLCVKAVCEEGVRYGGTWLEGG